MKTVYVVKLMKHADKQTTVTYSLYAVNIENKYKSECQILCNISM